MPNRHVFTHIRKEYSSKGLDIDQMTDDPFEQFEQWFNQAVELDATHGGAMTLATVSSSGAPSIRTVLLKHVDASGFVFFILITKVESLLRLRRTLWPHCVFIGQHLNVR